MSFSNDVGAAAGETTTVIITSAGPCAGAVAEQDRLRETWLSTHATGAASATALTVGAAGAVNGLAHRRRRSRGCGSRRSGSGLRLLAGSADADEIATALRVPRAVLADALTPRTVGPSLTDAKRSQRAPNEGSTHQPGALPRVMEPSASPLARSSKKLSSLAIG